MSAAQLIELASRYGIQITARANKLHLSAPTAPPLEVINLLSDHKGDLLAHVQASAVTSEASDSEPPALASMSTNHRRAWRAVSAMHQRQLQRLQASGTPFDPAGVGVFVEQWRDKVATRLGLRTSEVRGLQRDLQAAGLVTVKGCFIEQADGTAPEHTATAHEWETPSARLCWPPDSKGDYTGRAFVHWLDGWH